MSPVPKAVTAAELMTPAPRTCSKYSSVLEAVMIFRDADCGAVPIVDEDRPIGILTDRDVALAVAEYADLPTRSVGDLMTEGIATVPPEATIDQIAETFRDCGVRRLLVVDGTELVGILSIRDLAAFFNTDAP